MQKVWIRKIPHTNHCTFCSQQTSKCWDSLWSGPGCSPFDLLASSNITSCALYSHTEYRDRAGLLFPHHGSRSQPQETLICWDFDPRHAVFLPLTFLSSLSLLRQGTLVPGFCSTCHSETHYWPGSLLRAGHSGCTLRCSPGSQHVADMWHHDLCVLSPQNPGTKEKQGCELKGRTTPSHSFESSHLCLCSVFPCVCCQTLQGWKYQNASISHVCFT